MYRSSLLCTAIVQVIDLCFLKEDLHGVEVKMLTMHTTLHAVSLCNVAIIIITVCAALMHNHKSKAPTAGICTI